MIALIILGAFMLGLLLGKRSEGALIQGRLIVPTDLRACYAGTCACHRKSEQKTRKL